MLFSEENYRFMYAALTEAEYAFEKEEVPIGAVVVHNNKIIGRGYNQVESLKDPTAHAEMIAITAATNHLNSKILSECDLYITLEPCSMCTGAIILAKLNRIYFAAFEPKTGACGSIYNLIADNKLNHTAECYSGLMETESKNLLSKFFMLKRS